MSDYSTDLKAFNRPLIGTHISHSMDVNNILATGRNLRDRKLWEYPILPGAVDVYMQLASGKEWAVSGKATATARAIDYLNETQVYDFVTGQTHYGFLGFEQRRALDYLTVGRTALLNSDTKNKRNKRVEYLDPTHLIFNRYDLNPNSALDRTYPPVHPEEYVWTYADGRQFKAKEVILHHPIPIGALYFIAPLSYVIPTALLAWLIREHDTAKLDGRKIREIYFVGNAQLTESIRQAVSQQVAMWAGVNVGQLQVPIVEVNNPIGSKVADQIFTMGLSNLPENFDRLAFTDYYVNQIAASLGIALRQFWNNDKTTNRALEEVQEARQQQKGPAMFVRVEERLINQHGLLNHLSTRGSLRFSYVEEADLASRVTNAEVLLQTATALEKIRATFGTGISLSSYLAWMQSLGHLPVDLELTDEVAVPENNISTSDTPDIPTGEDEVIGLSDPPPSALTDSTKKPKLKNGAETKKTLDYDEVTINMHGHVIDRRRKVFPVSRYIKAELPDSGVETDAPTESVGEPDYLSNFQRMVDAVKTYRNRTVLSNQQLLSLCGDSLVEKLRTNDTLTPEEEEYVDGLYGEL